MEMTTYLEDLFKLFEENEKLKIEINKNDGKETFDVDCTKVKTYMYSTFSDYLDYSLGNKEQNEILDIVNGSLGLIQAFLADRFLTEDEKQRIDKIIELSINEQQLEIQKMSEEDFQNNKKIIIYVDMITRVKQLRLIIDLLEGKSDTITGELSMIKVCYDFPIIKEEFTKNSKNYLELLDKIMKGEVEEEDFNNIKELMMKYFIYINSFTIYSLIIKPKIEKDGGI